MFNPSPPIELLNSAKTALLLVHLYYLQQNRGETIAVPPLLIYSIGDYSSQLRVRSRRNSGRVNAGAARSVLALASDLRLSGQSSDGRQMRIM